MFCSKWHVIYLDRGFTCVITGTRAPMPSSYSSNIVQNTFSSYSSNIVQNAESWCFLFFLFIYLFMHYLLASITI